MTDAYAASDYSGASNNAVSGPTGADSVDTTGDFARLKKWILQAQRRRKFWRTEATRAYQYVANQQWSEADINLLTEQHRPSVTFNRVAPIIKAVCGLEVNNRQTVAYLPRNMENNGADEARSGAVRWVRDECNAEDEESEAFRDNAICGEGWTETRMDYYADPKGKIVEERIDPLEMGVNDGASRKNYVDARMVYRIRDMDVEDAQALFKENFEPEALNAKWLDDMVTPSDGGVGNKIDYPDQTRAAVGRGLGRVTKVRIIQVQWWDREPLFLVAQEGQQELSEMSPQEFQVYRDRVTAMEQSDAAAQKVHTAAMAAHPQAVVDHADGILSGALPVGTPTPAEPQAPTPKAPTYKFAETKKKCYYEAFLGAGLLEKSKMDMGEFRFVAMTGERDRDNRCFYGMLRDMFDPQMWANKWLSQTLHILNTNAKGGIMAETDAFVNVRKAETDWADNTKIIWVKPGSLEKNKIKERTPPPLPQGLGELMQFAISSLRDVTGVNLELLGQADREQAASLEVQRRQSAMTILATLFDSLRKFRKHQGRLLLHFTDMLPEGTLVRITENGLQKYIPFVKNRSAEEYDVIFDETPSSPDQKQATWAMTMQLLQGGVQLPPPALIKLLKYSPYPESVVAEISDAMGFGQTMPPEIMQQKLQQAEQAVQVLKQELQKATDAADTAQAEVSIKAAKVNVDGYNARSKRIAAILEPFRDKLNADTERLVFLIDKAIPDVDGSTTSTATDGTAGAPSAPTETLDNSAMERLNKLEDIMHAMQNNAHTAS